MTKTATSGGVRRVEASLVRLQEPPWDGIYRVVIGFLIFPMSSAVLGKEASGWSLAALFVGMLFTLRLGPAVLRKLLPFSGEVLGTWAKRRQIAKRYDSYQWRKLFWIGIGLIVHAVAFDGFWTARMVLASTCLASGLIGTLTWRAHRARHESWPGRAEPRLS
jgi:hypothetical protein